MDTQTIHSCLSDLSRELERRGIKGELCLYGGAAMCLAYHARAATKDVDAVFEPTQAIRDAAAVIAARHYLPSDWLNDAVKGFVVPHAQRVLLDLPALRVLVPEAEYLLAMKAIAARLDTLDQADVRTLIRHLNITSAPQVFDLLQRYYPASQVRPATRYFIEELFEA